MRFVVDECTGPTVAQWLRDEGHDVVSIFNEARGSKDETILARAFLADRILITNDKDFGDHIFRDRLPHKGIILLRLGDPRAINKIAALRRLFASHPDDLQGRFSVVTETLIRIVSPPPASTPP